MAVATAKRARTRQPEGNVFLSDDPLWYKDALIYQTHIRAFMDSNGDGIGDFRGLTQKLDYLQDLGVTAVWVLPFYPSPLKDDGYDIAGYTDVHPSYGTLADVRQFVREAHKRGLRVITELVCNHTSDQHPWFQKARIAKPGSAARNFYVWSSTAEEYSDARIIFKDFETSNWTWDPVAGAYYWHRFYSHQPDLNFDNPRVHQALFKVLDFWMETGIDGLVPIRRALEIPIAGLNVSVVATGIRRVSARTIGEKIRRFGEQWRDLLLSVQPLTPVT